MKADVAAGTCPPRKTGHPSAAEDFVAAAREILGDGHVRLPRHDQPDEQLRTVSGITRTVPAVLRPGTGDEVRLLVEAANRFRVPLYPVSRGRNWGMGGPLPVRDGCAVVDLSRMDRILEVNARHGYAVIEPGVTQGQLHAYLRENDLPFVFNVTGSGLDTSILGNALDRGVGYFSSRASNVSNLEVVLGGGRVLKTGFGHCEKALAENLYSFGVGPSLDGLLAQSNFGIVTRGTFELIPAERVQGAVVIGIQKEADLPRLVDALADLRRAGHLQTAVHIANRARSEASVCPGLYRQFAERGMTPADAVARTKSVFERYSRFSWTAIGGLLGTARQAADAVRAARRRLRGFGKVTFLTDRRFAVLKSATDLLRGWPVVGDLNALLNVMRPFYGMSKGIPTDAALDSVYWPVGDYAALGNREPQLSSSGLRYALPIVPLEGVHATAVSELAETAAKSHGLTAYITFNALNDRALEGVINIAYRRDDDASARAGEACIQALRSQLRERGYRSYRLGIDEMAGEIQPEDPFWRTVRDLKHVLDPNHIIAPGRYNLA